MKQLNKGEKFPLYPSEDHAPPSEKVSPQTFFSLLYAAPLLKNHRTCDTAPAHCAVFLSFT